ncbi:MAG: hypothetical protein QMD30_02245 [Methanothermobacter wolfeii]|nr:hypothetical protein [Methanothermobacter wolfeii]MDI6841233.1 hypothetical protein [Methanothermobacter wolfeii]
MNMFTWKNMFDAARPLLFPMSSVEKGARATNMSQIRFIQRNCVSTLNLLKVDVVNPQNTPRRMKLRA